MSGSSGARPQVKSDHLLPRLTLGLAVGLLLLSFGLRTVQLGAEELTFDEVGSFSIAARGVLGTLSYVSGAIREHPPFYYLLLSPWMRISGTTEFAIRFLSVIVGVTTVAALYRLSRAVGGPAFALLAAGLLGLSPFHIRISRDARMYGLLALWSLLSIFAFIALLHDGRRSRRHYLTGPLNSLLGRIDSSVGIEGGALLRWGLFWLVTGLGVFTHYFMLFVLLAQDLFLILSWRRHRHLLLPWFLVHLGLAGAVALWALSSPGLWATLLSLWNRGLASTVRWSALASALNGLYLGTDLRPNWYHLGLPLILTFFGLLPHKSHRWWALRDRRGRGLLLGLLVTVPILVVLALPERVTGRYLTPVLPAVVLAMAAGLAGFFYLVRDHLSGRMPGGVRTAVSCFPPLLLLSGLLFVNVIAYPMLYSRAGDSFVAKMEYLQANARSDDGLLLHGPWQQLLLSYYDAGSLDHYTVPLRDLRADADELTHYLGQLLETHQRLWVAYDSVEPVDPDWLVARWLHEHAHQVLSHKGLRLYVRTPGDGVAQSPTGDRDRVDLQVEHGRGTLVHLPIVSEADSSGYDRWNHVRVRFQNALRLEEVALSNLALTSGEAVLLYTGWQALGSIPSGLAMQLELVSLGEQVWQVYQFQPGPSHVPANGWDPGQTFVERRGLVIPLGTPPGDYKLRLRVFSSGNEWLPENGEPLDVGSVQVLPSTPPTAAVQALPGTDLRVEFAGTLALIGYAPWGRSFTQGNPLQLDLYWEALTDPDDDYQIELEVVRTGLLPGAGGTVLVSKRVQPVADWTPTSSWERGSVVRAHYALPIPADAPPGRYQLRLSVIGSDGDPLELGGTRSRQILGWGVAHQVFSGTDLALFKATIESRPRQYRVPAMDHRVNVVFGSSPERQMIQLLGYDLAPAAVQAGEPVEVTLYWKTLQGMDRIYAAFNHLVAADGTLLAQEDGWPGQGTYHTTLWLPGEVVTDRYAIQVPGDAQPGEYVLRLGTYDAGTGERLLVWVEDIQVPEGYVELARVLVEE